MNCFYIEWVFCRCVENGFYCWWKLVVILVSWDSEVRVVLMFLLD